MIDVKELSKRAIHLVSTGNTVDDAARKISAEFDAVAYMSKGKLWASYKDLNGKQTASVLI